MDTIIRNSDGDYYFLEVNLFDRIKSLALDYGWQGEIPYASQGGTRVIGQDLQSFSLALSKAYADLSNINTLPKVVLLYDNALSKEQRNELVKKWWNVKINQQEGMGVTSANTWTSFADVNDIKLCNSTNIDMDKFPPVVKMQAKRTGVIFLNMGLSPHELFSGSWKRALGDFIRFCNCNMITIHFG